MPELAFEWKRYIERRVERGAGVGGSVVKSRLEFRGMMRVKCKVTISQIPTECQRFVFFFEKAWSAHFGQHALRRFRMEIVNWALDPLQPPNSKSSTMYLHAISSGTQKKMPCAKRKL